MTKIENMIDLRAFCLEQAVKIKCEYKKAGGVVSETPTALASEYEKYILGGSEISKVPVSMDMVIYETMLKIINENKETNDTLEKLKETLANSKKE